MKTLLSRLLGIVFVFAFTAAIVPSHAGCPCKKPKPKQDESYQKIYLTPDQVTFHKNQLYVLVEGEVIEATAIHCDEGGLFVKESDCRKQGDCKEGLWECRNCHYCNQKYYLWCNRCGKS